MVKRKEKKIFWDIPTLLLGFIVGYSAHLLFDDSIFSDTTLTTEQTPPIFSNYLPTTTPLIQRTGYILAYDGRTRNAHWVYHKITRDTFKEKKTHRDLCEFKEDPLIPKQIRASKSDYKGSEFDRGHLSPAADTSTQTQLEETFFLSNISPQRPAFNRGYWKKVENHIRSLTKKYATVHVFSGPLYLAKKGRDGKTFVRYQVIGKNHVAVPTHFFALIFVETSGGKLQAKGYILPNKSIRSKTSLKKFASSVEEIESSSGVIFTHLLT